MPISQYSKIVPLQLVDDSSTDVLLASLDRRIKKDDLAQAKIQAYADAVGSIDILKVDDKEYFDKKYSEVIETINTTKSFDFSNPNNIRAMSDTLDTLLYDPNIKNSIESTKNFRNVSKELEIAMNNPKLRHTWNADTVKYDRYLQEQYINTPGGSFKQQHMTIYDEYNEKTLKAIKDVAITTKQVIGENGLLTEYKGKHALAVEAAINQGMGSSQMPRIEFSNLVRENPNFINGLYQGVQKNIYELKDKIREAEAGMIAAKDGSTYAKQQSDYIENLKGQLSGFEEVMKNPPNEATAFNLFMHNKKKQYLVPALVQDEIIKLNPVYAYNQKRNDDNIMRNHKMNMDVAGLRLDQAGYDLKAREFEEDLKYKYAALSVKEGEKVNEIDGVSGMSAIGGSVLSGDTSPYIIQDAFEEIKKDVAPEGKYFSKINEDFGSIKTSIAKINNLLTDPETKARINNALKAKGFKKGLESFDAVGAISPDNIYKFSAVIDDLFTEGISKNYMSEAIVGELRNISDKSSTALARTHVNRQVFNSVYKSLGIKEGTSYFSLTKDQKEKVLEKSNALFQEYGLETIEGKKKIRVNFDKEKGREGLTNLLKSQLVNNTKNITDLQGKPVSVNFDATKSVINDVDSDGYAYVTLKAIPKDSQGAEQLIGKENGYKFKLDKNAFQVVKDSTVGRSSSFGRETTLDDYLRVAKLDIASTTGFGNVSLIASSLDGLPKNIAVPFRVTSANSEFMTISVPYTGGDKGYLQNDLPIKNYTLYNFKSTAHFKTKLALLTREVLQKLNSSANNIDPQTKKPYTEDKKLRIAKDFALSTIILNRDEKQ